MSALVQMGMKWQGTVSEKVNVMLCIFYLDPVPQYLLMLRTHIAERFGRLSINKYWGTGSKETDSRLL